MYLNNYFSGVMFACFRFVFICAVFVYVHAVSSDTKCDKCEALVRIESGLICGQVRLAENATEYYSFRGVPYGRPPLREHRFQELQPAPAWEGIYDASEEGPACPQRDVFYGRMQFQPRGMSEDCIYANIHVPKRAKLIRDSSGKHQGPGLPILVFIPGGGYTAGSGNSDIHGPEFLMHLGRVIVVTFNYRLNVFGFLSLNDCQIPGNAGLRDQLTLLKWINRNARNFGGNPDDVTLMGQSVGATCAHLLSLSKAARGLFKRVVLMSGTAVPMPFTTQPEHARSTADALFKLLGYNTTDNYERHHLLTTLPLNEIMGANNILQMQYGTMSFTPTLEPNCDNFTRVVDSDPLTSIVEGRGKDLPLLIGFTDNEAQFFKWLLSSLDMVSRVERNPLILVPQRINLTYPDTAMEYAKAIKQYYFNGTVTTERIMNAWTDLYFQYPAMKLALWRSSMNAAPVYLYQYSYVSEMNIVKEGLWIAYNKSSHLEDLTFVFRVNSIMPAGYISFPPVTNDDKMRARMTMMILNFIHCSNPTCGNGEETSWNPVSADVLEYQNLAGPQQYTMEEPTVTQKAMINLLNSMDPDMRNIDDVLLNKS